VGTAVAIVKRVLAEAGTDVDRRTSETSVGTRWGGGGA